MVDVALFHSVLGVRPGVVGAARMLEAHGARVHVIDQYDGAVFDDYAEADAHARRLGYGKLMNAAAEACADLPPGFVCAGFSNGGGMALHVAAERDDVAGVLLFSGALDPARIGITSWRPATPVQIHYTVGDPFRNQAWIDALTGLVRTSGAQVEVFDYPGSGHLFTDPSRPGEYDRASTELLWSRAFDLIDRIAAEA